MSFNYAPASTSIIKGNGFYRIKANSIDLTGGNEPKIGPGDLIPIDVGFSAIAVGPESDYENYELIFVDPIAPGSVQVIPLSKSVPFVGSVTADNSTPYPNSGAGTGGDIGGEPAKAFVRIADKGTLLERIVLPGKIVNRTAFAVADLIIYTGVPPVQLIKERTPKKRASVVPLSSGNPNNFYIPGYGRKHFTLSLLNAPPGVPIGAVVSATLTGLRFFYPLDSTPGTTTGKVVEAPTRTILMPSAVVPSDLQNEFVFAYNAESGGKGFFDFYWLEVISDTAVLPSDGVGFRVSMEVRD